MTLLLSSFLGGGFAPPPPTPPFFLALASSQTLLSKRHQKVIIFFALLKVSFLKHSLFEKKWWPPIFSGNAIKIGVLEDFEKPVFFAKKKWKYFLPVLKAPHFWGVTFFFGFFFFSSFFLFLLHLARGCAKKTYFYRVFWHTLLKHLVTIMQQQ